jgi:tetratricopeptide (TPR) repeat protein
MHCLFSLFCLATPPNAKSKVPPPDETLRFLEQRTKSDPDDFVAFNQLISRYLQKLRETGDYAYLPKAHRAVDASLRAAPAESNISGLHFRARVQLAEHRFADAMETGRQLIKTAPNKAFSYAALGDALVEFGEISEARSAFTKMEELDRASVDTTSRLARLALLSGDVPAARKQFEAALAAAKELFPASPSTVAWCEVQLGELAFNRGEWREAETSYESALKTFPDYFAAIDHLAELRAAQGDCAAAVALYQPLADRLARPDVMQNIGDVFAFFGKSEEAKSWHDRALAGYLESASRGEVHYLHHLAAFFSDVREQPAEAINWARKDLELRHSAGAHETLAWALYRGGDFKQAVDEIQQAVHGGGHNPHVLYHAAMIFSSAGELERGQQYLREALTLNPKYNAFHVHR